MSYSTRRTDLIALLFLSFSILLWEILLTRLYSVMLFHHFAFVAVSVAMFGLTCGAVRIAFQNAPAGEDQQRELLGQYALWTGTLMMFSAILQISIPPSFEGRHALTWTLLRTYVTSALPFFPAGAYLAVYLTRFKGIGKLYASDLAGAGLACLSMPMVISTWGGPGAVCIAAAVACLAAWFAFPIARGRSRLLALLFTIGLICFATWNIQRQAFRIRWRQHGLQEQPLHERWNAFSRITVRAAEHASLGRGIDSKLQANFSPVQQLRLEIDSGAGTALVEFKGDLSSVDFLRYDVTHFAHYLRPEANVFIIGSGGGAEILSALLFHQKRIVGVEVNPAIVEAAHKTFGDFTGRLDRYPHVRIHAEEGRSYLARNHERFDIIQASLVDTLAATSAGAYAFVENGLYTKEAWTLFLERLSPGGVLSISRWHTSHDRFSPAVKRLVALGEATLRDAGIQEPARHMMIVHNYADFKNPGIATLLLSNSPFTTKDMSIAQKNARALHAGISVADTQKNPWLASPEGSPPTDNKPYFFFNGSLRDFSSWKKPAERTLLSLLVFTLCLALALCVIPGLLLRQQNTSIFSNGRHVLGLASYFGLIGAGFMLLEVAWMQRFGLYLGHPTYGFTIILFGILSASAFGSLCFSWWGEKLASILTGMTVLSLFAFEVVSHTALHATAGASLSLRVLVTVVLVTPQAFMMGFWLPLGMKFAEKHAPLCQAWYWSINGALSVLGSIIATLFCLTLGIQETIAVGALCYLSAAVIVRGLDLLKLDRKHGSRNDFEMIRPER